MHVILLCGGNGKRLWPLSSDKCPKQFIKYIKNEKQYISMLQRTYNLISKKGFDISVITSEKYKGLVEEQLKDVNIILEPESRNTFPAVMLGLANSIYEKRLDEKEIIVFFPIDSYAEESFYDVLNDINSKMPKESSGIGLVGIKATEPSSEYGYIINKNGKVEKFIEKPSIELANKLLKKGALYNSGIFAVRVNYGKKLLNKYMNINNYEEFLVNFEKLTSTSFDYEVLEKEKDISCIETSSTWMDIGTFKNFERILDKESIGKVEKYECSKTTIINKLEIPVKAIGVDNLIVVVTEDGILISKKM